MNSIQQDLANKRGDMPVPDALPLTDSAFGEPEKVVNPFGDGKAHRLGEPRLCSGTVENVLLTTDGIGRQIYRLNIKEAAQERVIVDFQITDIKLQTAFAPLSLIPAHGRKVDYAVTWHEDSKRSVCDSITSNGPSGEELAGYFVDQAMAAPGVVTEQAKEPLMLEGHEFVPDWTEAHKTQAQYDAMHAKKENQPMVDKTAPSRAEALKTAMASFTRQCTASGVPDSKALRDRIRHEVSKGVSWTVTPEQGISYGELLMGTKAFIESGTWKRLDADGSYADADAITAGRETGQPTDKVEQAVALAAEIDELEKTLKDAPVSPDTANETRQAPKTQPAPDLTAKQPLSTIDSETGEILLPTGNALVPFNGRAAVVRAKIYSDVVRTMRNDGVLVNGKDYGVIPGAGDKPTLFKPGAEKLCNAFQYCPRFLERHVIRQFDPANPLFYFEYECELTSIESGKVIATSIGICHSMESKYRWRKSERVCPHCDKATIIKGKEEFGGGWICFAKKGGCGAKFGDKDKAIIDQTVGQVANDDIFSLINTISKMSQKRALVAAVLIGANASEFFTQDIEDFGYIDAEIVG